jgi:hypothetical protein
MAVLTKIHASTLVETIVAMVIISITFAVAFFILSAITGKSDPQLKLRACTEIQNVIYNSISKKDFRDEKWDNEGLHFEKVVLPFRDYDSLRILEVKAHNNSGRLLVVRKELIKLQE